jgi:hypothetical protein
MSALFLFMDEIVTGQSLPQQFLRLIGEPMWNHVQEHVFVNVYKFS